MAGVGLLRGYMPTGMVCIPEFEFETLRFNTMLKKSGGVWSLILNEPTYGLMLMGNVCQLWEFCSYQLCLVMLCGDSLATSAPVSY
jgi:hypothetical protein